MNKTQIISSIIEELTRQGYDAAYQQINKNGVMLDAVTLKNAESNIAPIISR